MIKTVIKIELDVLPDPTRPVWKNDNEDRGPLRDLPGDLDIYEVEHSLGAIPVKLSEEDQKIFNETIGLAGLPNYLPVFSGPEIREAITLERIVQNGIIVNEPRSDMRDAELELVFHLVGIKTQQTRWTDTALYEIFEQTNKQ